MQIYSKRKLTIKPLIGVNVDIRKGPPELSFVHSAYYDAIHRAGGIPLILPPIVDDNLDQILDTIHGVMLIGAEPDYSPEIYGEQKLLDGGDIVHQKKQDFDIAIVKRITERADKPLLGICAGHQLLNIAMGGSLIQDIDTQLPKSEITHTTDRTKAWTEGWTKHQITIEPDSRIGRIYGKKEIEIMSWHHQCIKELAKDLHSVAVAADGIIEAVESNSKNFVVGVQWHPERAYAENSALFLEFVKEASQNL